MRFFELFYWYLLNEIREFLTISYICRRKIYACKHVSINKIINVAVWLIDVLYITMFNFSEKNYSCVHYNANIY